MRSGEYGRAFEEVVEEAQVTGEAFDPHMEKSKNRLPMKHSRERCEYEELSEPKPRKVARNTLEL